MNPGVRLLKPTDRDAALSVINSAARWYREFLPEHEHHDPEMTIETWNRECERVIWYGAFDVDTLLGVMGLEYIREVALLRHAYVSPEKQRQGVSTLLLNHVEGEIEGNRRVIVGTYALNYKARALLESCGYTLSADSDSALRAYYSIPEGRRELSVAYEKKI